MCHWTREMAQWLRALDALASDQCFVLNTQHQPVTAGPGDVMPLASRAHTHGCK